MSLVLHAHPFSSNCQKVLIALYENDLPFEFRMLADAASMAALEKLWPLKKFPVLEDDGHVVLETSIIIEYLQRHHPGPVRLLPDDPDAALEVRLMDRFFDNYVSTPQSRVVYDALRPPEHRDPYGVEEAKRLLQTAYGWLESRLQGRHWAAGEAFSMADCAAAPFLFYADWTHPISQAFPTVRAYRSRVLARPSVRRAVDEARPYRKLFPLGAPDRD